MEPLYRLRQGVAEAATRLYNQGFMPGGDGNISVRVSSNLILITPSNIPKGALKASQIIMVNRDGKVLEGDEQPSSELRMHLVVYQKRDDIGAVVHAHTPYIITLSVAGQKLLSFVLPEVTLKLGDIMELGYALPSSGQVAELMAPYVKSSDVFVLKNHGSVTLGKDLDDAVMKMEVLEHFGRVLFQALLLGKVEAIPEQKREELLQFRQQFMVNQDKKNRYGILRDPAK